MNTQLETALADAVNKTIELGGRATDFAMGEIPDIAHQLLVWKTGVSIFGIGIGLVLLSVLLLIFKKKEWYFESEEKTILYILVSAACGVAGPIVVLCNTFNLLQIWLAPKIFLMEYAANLVASK